MDTLITSIPKKRCRNGRQKAEGLLYGQTEVQDRLQMAIRREQVYSMERGTKKPGLAGEREPHKSAWGTHSIPAMHRKGRTGGGDTHRQYVCGKGSGIVEAGVEGKGMV